MLQLSKYKKIIVLVIVTGLLIWTINVTSQPREKISFPEKIVGYIMFPVQKAFYYINVQANETWMFFNEIGASKEDKVQLSLRVQLLEDEIRKLNDIKIENQRLTEMLKLKEQYSQYDLEYARVIGRNPENLNNVILIDKGTNNGVKVNSEVLSVNGGLVGKTIEVAPDWSKVMLITDPESSVSSMVDRTRDLSVIKGDSVASKYGFVKLTYALPDTDIITDDIVVTSGFGGIFSKGILIGKVKEVKQEATGLTKYAYVEPTADFKRIEEVAIIKQK